MQKNEKSRLKMDKFVKYLRLFQKNGMILWSVLFFIPQAITNVYMQISGVSLAFIAFYWLIQIGILVFALMLAWKSEIFFSKIVAPPFFVFVGYIYFRYLQESTLALNPMMFLFNAVIMVVMLLELLIYLLDLLIELISLDFLRAFRRIDVNNKTKIAVLLLVIYSTLISWSYIGFSQTYLVKDPHQTDFRVSFWGYPSAGLTYSKYNTPELDQELAIYKELNATFIFPNHAFTLNNSARRANLSNVMHELEKWDIDFICDSTPLIYVLNKSSDKYYLAGDFVTYYYAKEVNDTIDLIMDWVEEENFTNFRGISLDIEGPHYGNSSMPISLDAYQKGLYSFQAKMDEFRERFPGKIVNMIAMDGILWDYLDGDHDLDVKQLTVSTELDFDVYGYMTYMTGSASPGFSDYRYAYYMKQGIQQHGLKFQPWVGWWYDPESDDDPDVIENPIVYNQSIQQFKIAKSFGVKEIVLAPVRNFLGKNQTEGIKRLQEILAISKDGFGDFRIPITNNMRLVYDPEFWWKKIFPTYWISNDNILQDLFARTSNNWFLFTQMFVAIAVIGMEISFRRRE